MMYPTSKLDQLGQLARARFDPLTDAEVRLLSSALKGGTAYCGTSERDDDPDNDPEGSDQWAPQRYIRAELIRWLCIDPDARTRLDPRGLQTHGARISGKLDLSFLSVPFRLAFRHCSFFEGLDIRFVEVPSLDLRGTTLRGLNADNVTVKGSILLNGVHARGEVLLRGMRVGGNLSCDGGTFQNPPLEGALSTGIALNAEGSKVAGAVLFRNRFSAEGQVRLFRSEIGRELECDGGKFENPAKPHVPLSGIALHAYGMRVSGGVFLRRGSFVGEVRLNGTDITGGLFCDGSKFQCPPLAETGSAGVALNLEGSRISGAVLLRNGFSAEGQVRLFRTGIGADLECIDGKFDNPAVAKLAASGIALHAYGAKVAGAALFRNASFLGQVRLTAAEIGGDLACDGTRLESCPISGVGGTGLALLAESAMVGGAVLLRNRFTAEGQVRLYRAKIGGNLSCQDGSFNNPAKEGVAESGIALNAEAVEVGGAVYFRGGFVANGEVRLYAADIGGNLECDGGTFRNPPSREAGGVALLAEGVKVAGAVFLRNGFVAAGQVRFYGARVGGNFVCSGGKFENPPVEGLPGAGTALLADGAKIAGGVYLSHPFEAEGQVRMFGSEVGGNLYSEGGVFRNPLKEGMAGSGLALTLEGLKASRAVCLRAGFAAQGTVRLFAAEVGTFECVGTFDTLDLRNASAASLLDNKESWPEVGKLFLDGFVYGRISGGPATAEERLVWLARQSSFTRQPYRQLARVLQEAGDDRGWRRVSAEMERRAWNSRSRAIRAFGHLLRYTIGYGYHSVRALGWLLALVTVGALLYGWGYRQRHIVPTQKDAYDKFVTCKQPLPGNYEPFQAVSYSFENSFPLVRLGIEDKWTLGVGGNCFTGPSNVSASWYSVHFASIGFLSWFRRVQICLGWILATLFVGGVTGVIRKG